MSGLVTAQLRGGKGGRERRVGYVMWGMKEADGPVKVQKGWYSLLQQARTPLRDLQEQIFRVPHMYIALLYMSIWALC